MIFYVWPLLPLICLYVMAYKRKQQRTLFLVLATLLSVVFWLGGNWLFNSTDDWNGLLFGSWLIIGQYSFVLNAFLLILNYCLSKGKQ